MSKAKRKIDLTIGKHRTLPPIHKIPIVKGVGKKDIEIPKDLAERALKNRDGKVTVKQKKDSFLPKFLTNMFFTRRLWDLIKPAVPVAKDKDFQALVDGADAIQSLMVERQYDAYMEGFFSRMETEAAWALANMDTKFRAAIIDHQRQVKKLKTSVKEALPKVVTELAKRNPGVPVPALIEHAVGMLAQELEPILAVLSVYTDTFEQYRSLKLPRLLKAINQYMEGCFHRFQKGGIPMSSYKVGDVLLAGFGGPGLGTIPAEKGPIGMHLLMVPLDMRDWLSVGFALFGHESRHQILSDVNNMEEESQQVVRAAIVKACNTRKVVLTTETTRIGRSTVSTRDLLIKMVTDCIGEIDADLAGGILAHGPAYLYAMLLSFPAMLIRSGRVKDTKQLLRSSSVYSAVKTEDGKTSLEFEAHPPDWIRTYFVAAALEEIGYKAEADKLRKLADLAVGETPEFITWEDAAGKSSVVISIASADIKAIAPVVARALIRTPLESLNGKSTGDMVMWDAKQQDIVDGLTATLVSGKSNLPANKSAITENLIGAASVTAYWQGAHSANPGAFLTKLEENTLTMLEAIAA